MIFHFAANALNIAFGDDISAAHHHDAIGNDVDLVQDVTRNDDVHTGL